MSKFVQCSNCRAKMYTDDTFHFNECEGEFIYCDECAKEIDPELSDILTDEIIENYLDMGQAFLDEE